MRIVPCITVSTCIYYTSLSVKHDAITKFEIGLKKINCTFPFTRHTHDIPYFTPPTLNFFSAPKIHFIPVDKFWFTLSHLNVTINLKNYLG